MFDNDGEENADIRSQSSETTLCTQTKLSELVEKCDSNGSSDIEAHPSADDIFKMLSIKDKEFITISELREIMEGFKKKQDM